MITKRIKILIIEAYTDANVGSAALVENAIGILKSKYPNSMVCVMAQNPLAFQRRYGVDTIPDIFKYPNKKPRVIQVAWFLKSLVWIMCTLVWVSFLPFSMRRGLVTKSRLAPFLWADIIVSVGAERINDKFYKSVLFSFFTYYVIKRLGCILVLFPSTIGPLFFGWSKLVAARTLGKIDLLYTRDALSTRVVTSLNSTRMDRIVETSDVAILQPMIDRERALEIIGLGLRERIVGISALRWSYFRNRIETDYSNYPTYVKQMAAFVEAIIDRYGLTVVFYPTNFPVHGCTQDDVAVSIEIRDNVANSEKVSIVGRLPSPAELKGMLACSEVNVTARMHACILSTGAGIPTMSINYLPKVRAYMESIGLSEFSIDIEEFNAECALQTFDKLYGGREKWRDHLQRTFEKRRKQLWNSMERLDALLE